MRDALPSLGALRAFALVAETGSLTAAAARLNVTQPAVSRRLRELEAELGVALVRRGANALGLTEEGARLLVDAGAALVGIDSLNIDDKESGGARPVHTLLLGAGIHIVEHLTNLEGLPERGSRFTAVPPKIAGFGTFPVRAFAEVD